MRSRGLTRGSQLEVALKRDLTAARARTLALLESVSEGDLERRADPALGPGLWDVGHLACFEDLWGVGRVLGPAERATDDALAELYDAFEQPRSIRADLALLDRDAAFELLEEVRRRTLNGLGEADLDGNDPLVRGGFVYRMLIQHEAQHQETLLQSLERLARSAPVADDADLPAPAVEPPDDAERIAVPPGRYSIGCAGSQEPYDNELPRHVVECTPFAIDRFPVTNRRYLQFMGDGGYGRPELWTEAGSDWLARSGVSAPGGWRAKDGGWNVVAFGRERAVDPREPVQHVSCHEAEAFARWAGGRLPTEFEWEAAATAGQQHRRRYPWGDAPATEEHANLDLRRCGPAPVGSFPSGASPLGVEQLLGDVYEWTASEFDGYPGFRPFPYPEYSEVFFRRGYRVLRGASWAAASSLARASYRNWDLPERRQLFAGFRLAWDV